MINQQIRLIDFLDGTVRINAVKAILWVADLMIIREEETKQKLLNSM
jgi:hypothetical protein